MKNIAIHKATAAEYAGITAVWEASVRASHHFLSEEDIARFRPLILNEYLKMVELYYARGEDGIIAGFLATLNGKIEMLFLHPSQFGRGLGHELLQFAIEKLGAHLVDVNEQNERAVQFYLHHGFTVEGRSEVDGLGKPFPLLHLKLATRP